MNKLILSTKSSETWLTHGMAKDMCLSPTQMIHNSYCIFRHNSCSAFIKEQYFECKDNIFMSDKA